MSWSLFISHERSSIRKIKYSLLRCSLLCFVFILDFLWKFVFYTKWNGIDNPKIHCIYCEQGLSSNNMHKYYWRKHYPKLIQVASIYLWAARHQIELADKINASDVVLNPSEYTIIQNWYPRILIWLILLQWGKMSWAKWW